jgi:hypothetical protein
MQLSRLALHMPDADALTGAEIGAAIELKPAAMLVLCYAQWDGDKGVAQSIRDLVRTLGHDRLYVRFHSDPNPIAYARKIGGPEAWGRLCAKRMSQYYGTLDVAHHAILANEVDAAEEGGLVPKAASDFYRRALAAYEAERPQDILHVPAPTGAPETHRAYLQQYKHDGWLNDRYWIDGHGYGPDLPNVCNVLEEECPEYYRVITETNDVNLAEAASMAGVRAHEIIYFTLNWARGGEGRVQPPSADDAAKQMSLMRFPDRYAQFKATLAVPEPPMTEIERFIRDAAQARGIDPDIAVRVAKSEGGVTEPARRGTFETGSSWWPLQLHYGGAGYEYLGGVAGMGNGFTALTGWQPGDPAAWRDSVRYALNRAKANGWGAWYGAAAAGVGQWDGIDRDHPWEASAERWDFEEGTRPGAPPAEPTKVTYNAAEPAFAQNDPWSCAPTSTRWALHALGRRPTEQWIEDRMVKDGIVSKDEGLLDATGKALADWITAQYQEWGYYSNSEPAVSFDAVFAEVGPYPLLLGGRRWGHWSGVRASAPTDGVLLLANPAEGWQGVGQTMNREQFAALGPFSMVRILHPDLIPGEAPAPPTPAPEPTPVPPAMTLTEVRARLEQIQSEITALLAQLPAA